MLNKDEVKKIALLARIGISDKEVEKYRHDMAAILDYFKKLEELDTEGIEPIGHITGRENVMREDKKEDFGAPGKEAILANAPEVKDGFIKVKPVL
jgi:aspartyl-tRNA(Asn)/glutamyl-tRNA(Gln) amidotransferase subunit C